MPFVRKALLVCIPIALNVLLLAALPSPASASDKDCSDFRTQRAAQIFFLKHGGPRHDPHRLDGDDDGRACEDNPCPCSYRQHLSQRGETFLNADRRLLLRI
ncbi:MAG TPA: excalibur calcium-binding domain-containing protein [Solirubrobacterales bacterium]|nr:excalibur calcium-binding domain-containing protein [Solirubrobacterales bacterium]